MRDRKIVGSVSHSWNIEKQFFDHCYMFYVWMHKIIIQGILNPHSTILVHNVTEKKKTCIHSLGKWNAISIIIIIVLIKHLNSFVAFTILHLWMMKRMKFYLAIRKWLLFIFHVSFLGHGDIPFCFSFNEIEWNSIKLSLIHLACTIVLVYRFPLT